MIEFDILKDSPLAFSVTIKEFYDDKKFKYLKANINNPIKMNEKDYKPQLFDLKNNIANFDMFILLFYSHGYKLNHILKLELEDDDGLIYYFSK